MSVPHASEMSSGERPPVRAVRALGDLASLAREGITGKALRDAILERAKELFAADAVALWRIESRENIWRIAAANGFLSDFSSVRIPVADIDEARASLTQVAFTRDALQGEPAEFARALDGTESIASFLIIPLYIRGKATGAITCYWRTPREEMGEMLLEAAKAFGEIASVALSTERFDQLGDVARDVAGRLDLESIVQRITDAATQLTGAQFGAFFYNMIREDGEAYTLYTISGVPRAAFEKFPMPRNTHVFAPTFSGSGILRSDNITKDPRYGQNAPYFGMPKGHLPVVSYLAVPVMSHSGEVIGGLFFGHSAEGVFGETEELVADALAGYAAVAIDNTRLYERLERDRAALRKEENRYRSLVLTTPTRQAIAVTSARGELTQHSQSWSDITGQSMEELRGGGWADAIHPDHRARVQETWAAALEARSVFEEKYLLRQKDGAYRWFSVKAVPVYGADGAIEEWVAAIIDVHDQQIAQEGLRFLARANELFASSLDYRETLKNLTFLAVPRVADWCAVDMVNTTGERLWDRVAVAHIDPSKISLADEMYRKYPPDPDTDGIYQVMRTGEPMLMPDISDELLQQTARSPEHLDMLRSLGLLSSMIVPLRTRGEVIGTVTFVASERRFTQQDLAHAEELAYRASIAIENARLYSAAQSANRAKDEFLATLSHELRTPMTAVLGWSRMLKMGLSEGEAQVAIDAIERSATAQAQLIEDVLDVSRIMAGKLTFDPRPVDLGTVAHAAITTVHPAAVAKGIEILTSIPPALPPVSGDDGRLQQVIWNLLANAIKFTPRGGTVTIRVQHLGSILRLTIADTGEGIDRQFLPYVFEPFRQADSSTTRPHPGIGLGLAIVRSLVEMHGGRIRAASEGKGRGATFTLELPVIEAAPTFAGKARRQHSVLPPASTSLPSLTGLTVLVVDDQEYTREIIAAILRRTGAAVQTAESVREALQIFQRISPDVVLCDIAMPEEDGYVFLRAVRERPDASRATPVLAVTAFGRPEDRIHALDAGFNAYLKKPIDPAELAEAVQRLTAGR